MAKRAAAPDCYDYVRRTYGVPAYVGMRVRLPIGTEGVLVAAKSDLHYIHVRVDGRKHADPVHPQDVTYLTVETKR